MKAFMKTTFATLLVCALFSIGAYAGDKGKTEKKMVTLTDDIMVNGTLVKAGDYEIKFDETAGTLSILRNGKVKATAPAHLEQRTDKAKNTSLRTVEKDNLAQLLGVTFGGWNQDVILGTSSAGVAGSQQ
ncbi:MAG: hypothetical protein DMF75_08445 [Acidobacteria bacterium]|nr:MAG: hypothetical protein DMF75_08445 [Acidobacteriota bacterium]PYS62395.1 MAG: hypothetical protein DMF76_09010 [Acidobacteriota bacterium]